MGSSSSLATGLCEHATALQCEPTLFRPNPINPPPEGPLHAPTLWHGWQMPAVTSRQLMRTAGPSRKHTYHCRIEGLSVELCPGMLPPGLPM